MPVDALPIETGEFVLLPAAKGEPLTAAHVQSADLEVRANLKHGSPRYRSHFVTCPNADRHRK